MLRRASAMELRLAVVLRAAKDPMGPGDLRQGGATGDAELALDARAVPLDGADAELDLLGDLAVRVAKREQREDLALATAELVGSGRAVRRGGDGHFAEPEPQHVGDRADQA